MAGKKAAIESGVSVKKEVVAIANTSRAHDSRRVQVRAAHLGK